MHPFISAKFEVDIRRCLNFEKFTIVKWDVKNEKLRDRSPEMFRTFFSSPLIIPLTWGENIGNQLILGHPISGSS